MSAVDELIGAGAVLAGGVLTYIGSSRDRRQRARDASESRDFANRREACLLLERQRDRQLETAKALVKSLKHGVDFGEREDHSDLQNPDVDAMVSLFLPDPIEKMVEETNGLWSSFLSSCRAIESAEIGQAKISAYEGMDDAFELLRVSSTNLRQGLRKEARSK
jgi:hypothetical protein